MLGSEGSSARRFVRSHEALLVDMAEIINAAAPNAAKDEVAGLLAGAMAWWFRRKKRAESS